VKYIKDIKYQITENTIFHIRLRPKERIISEWGIIYKSGKVWIRKDFTNDGGTFARDNKRAMSGFLLHDFLFYLMRNGFLPQSYIEEAGNEMERQHKKDGVWKFRRKYLNYFAARFGAKYASPEYRRKIYNIGGK